MSKRKLTSKVDISQRTSRQNEHGQNQRGWAKGVRAEIMHRHVEVYAKARMTGGWIAERKVWLDCCREFNHIVAWHAPDDQEVVGPLRAYDADAVAVVEDALSSEETLRKGKILRSRNDVSSS